MYYKLPCLATQIFSSRKHTHTHTTHLALHLQTSVVLNINYLLLPSQSVNSRSVTAYNSFHVSATWKFTSTPFLVVIGAPFHIFGPHCFGHSTYVVSCFASVDPVTPPASPFRLLTSSKYQPKQLKSTIDNQWNVVVSSFLVVFFFTFFFTSEINRHKTFGASNDVLSILIFQQFLVLVKFIKSLLM